MNERRKIVTLQENGDGRGYDDKQERESERWSQSVTDRQRRRAEWRGGQGRGGGRAGVGEMRVESKPQSSADLSVKDTVLKRWIACALYAKACPRQ